MLLLTLLLGAPVRAGTPADPVPVRTARGTMAHEDLREWLAGADALALDPTPLALSGALEVGLTTATFEQGVAFALRAPDSEVPQGFVFVGQGRAEVSTPEPGAGLYAANRLALEHGPSPRLARLAREGRLAVTFDEALVRALTPEVAALLAAAAPAPADPQAEARAREILAARAPLRATPATDRLKVELLGQDPASSRSLLHLHTDLPGERWLLSAADRSGLMSSTRDAEVWLGEPPPPLAELGRHRTLDPEHPLVSGDALLAARPFPARAEVRDEPVADALLVPLSADARAWVRHVDKRTCSLRVDTELLLEARGGPVQVFHLEVPRREARPGTWSLEWLEVADAVPLVYSEQDPRAPLDGLSDTLGVVLPRPVREGYQARLRLTWSGTWDREGRGRSCVGQLRFLPSLRPGRVGDPVPFTLYVGSPPKDRTVAAAPGAERFLGVGDDDLSWAVFTHERGEAVAPVVVLGDWRYTLDAGGDPRLTINLHRKQRRSEWDWSFAVRDAKSFLEGFLPPWPGGEALRVMQHHGRWEGYLGLTAPGMLDLSRVYGGPGLLLRENRPFPELGAMVSRLAAAWWGQGARVPQERDLWIPDALGETVSAMFLSSVVHPDVGAARMAQASTWWQRPGSPPSAALTRGAQEAWGHTATLYGSYVMFSMLRPRIGDEAFLRGLTLSAERAARGPLDTEGLREAFEQASGRDLRPFFDTWVHSGFIPSFTLHVDAEPRDGRWVVLARATSDVPYGEVDLPLVIRDGAGRYRTVFVPLVDGVGDWVSEPLDGEAPPTVRVDPGGLTLRRGIRVTSGPGLPEPPR